MTEQAPAAGAPAADNAENERARGRIAEALDRSRQRSMALTAAVDEPDLVAQHSPLMSPLVWDYAHIANMEELWLVRDVGGRQPLRPEIDEIYDAFEHPRNERPSLPLLTPEQARSYAANVRSKVTDILDRVSLTGRPLTAEGFAFGMIAQHEQQHDETMLATHQLRRGSPVLHAPDPPPAHGQTDADEVLVPAGEFTMGTSSEPWALDNERPAHRVDVPAFYLDTTPVTGEAFVAFIEAGGYRRPELWDTEGYDYVQRAELAAPLFWQRQADGTWWRRRFGVMEPVPLAEPVLHVSFYEAAAYARWAGKRLPTEAEWEKAARHEPATGRSLRYPWGDADPTPERANLGQRHLRPAAAGAYPRGAAPCGAQQLIGDVWEWVDSEFLPYPGFRAFPYPEYSQVFFGGNRYRMLRGGSFGTDAVACRGTFRNWDLPIRRQIFSGFRCARDAPAHAR